MPTRRISLLAAIANGFVFIAGLVKAAVFQIQYQAIYSQAKAVERTDR
jgi:hypothetical protein